MKIFSQSVFTKQNFGRFLSLSFYDKILISLELSLKYIQKKMNFKWKYNLYVDNIHNHENLLIILAWYQQYTRDIVFDRVKKFIDIPIDICIVTPWKNVSELENICKINWWSYLVTKSNKCSLWLNLAISVHKKAKYIYKIDEDIFITEWLFKNLREKFDYVLEKTDIIPWWIAPVINLNNFSFNFFLKVLGKKNEFKKIFPNFKQQISVPWCNIWHSQDVVKYVWNITGKLDEKQWTLFKKQNIYEEDLVMNWVRFTIWCFLFSRKIWENMWGFDTNVEWLLWKDETSYLDYCINNSYPIVLCENSLVWHLSFWPQKNVMKEFFEKNKFLFSINDNHE